MATKRIKKLSIRKKIIITALIPFISLLLFFTAILIYSYIMTNKIQTISKVYLPLQNQIFHLDRYIRRYNGSIINFYISHEIKNVKESKQIWKKDIIPTTKRIKAFLINNDLSTADFNTLLESLYRLNRLNVWLSDIIESKKYLIARVYYSRNLNPLVARIKKIINSIDNPTLKRKIYQKQEDSRISVYNFIFTKSDLDLIEFNNTQKEISYLIEKTNCLKKIGKKSPCEKIFELHKLIRQYNKVATSIIKTVKSARPNIVDSYIINQIIPLQTKIGESIHHQIKKIDHKVIEAIMLLSKLENNLTYIILFSLATAIAITFFLLQKLSENIIKPIQLISSAAKKLAAYKDIEDVHVPRDGELEELAQSFNLMRATRLKNEQQIKAQNEKLIHLSRFDLQTNLPNKTYFLEYAESYLKTAEMNKNKFAIIICDVFELSKQELEEDALNELGIFFKQFIAKPNFCSYFSRNRFVILLANMRNSYEVFILLTKIDKMLAEPFKLTGKTHTFKCNSGVSLYPENETNIQTLITQALVALEKGKARIDEAIVFYSEEDKEERKRKADISKLIISPENKKYFSIVYQPIYSTQDMTIASVETLLRFKHPVTGIVPPEELIAIAEDLNIVTEIDLWVISNTLKMLKSAEEKLNGTTFRLAFNLSILDTYASHFEQILAELSKHHLESVSLQAEITETVFSKNISNLEIAISALSFQGITISIDDFGTGYSSLSRLRLLNINEIKIDKSFIYDIANKQEATDLVKGIIKLGHALGCQLVAEGVETKAQFDRLKVSVRPSTPFPNVSNQALCSSS